MFEAFKQHKQPCKATVAPPSEWHITTSHDAVPMKTGRWQSGRQYINNTRARGGLLLLLWAGMLTGVKIYFISNEIMNF